jgi:hypothetical protein
MGFDRVGEEREFMTEYDPIFQWKMNAAEAAAYKLAVIWEQQTKKYFPDEKITRLPKKSDPRKSNLYRYCWKLVRETRGLLKPEEYKLYIIAQLQIIKKFKGRVEPNCLVGEKAWIRWRVWKRMFDRKMAEQKNIEVNPPPADSSVVKDLDKTKLFLYEKCGGVPTPEKLQELTKGGKLYNWIDAGKISKVYLILSPIVAAAFDMKELSKKCGFMPDFYKSKATADIVEHFKSEFAEEFRSSETS